MKILKVFGFVPLRLTTIVFVKYFPKVCLKIDSEIKQYKKKTSRKLLKYISKIIEIISKTMLMMNTHKISIKKLEHLIPLSIYLE